MKLDETDRRLVIFIHGFGSGKDSTKYAILKEQLDPHYFVVDIVESDYTTTTKNEIQANLDQVLSKYVSYPQAILVGHSLGGYWARVMAQTYFLPNVLVNPSLKPWETLKGKIPGAEYHPVPCVRVDVPTGRSTEYVYIELGDEVVDQQSQIDAGFFKESKLTVVSGGHHRIEFINNVVNEVKKLDECMNILESFIYSD